MGLVANVLFKHDNHALKSRMRHPMAMTANLPGPALSLYKKPASERL